MTGQRAVSVAALSSWPAACKVSQRDVCLTIGARIGSTRMHRTDRVVQRRDTSGGLATASSALPGRPNEQIYHGAQAAAEAKNSND